MLSAKEHKGFVAKRKAVIKQNASAFVDELEKKIDEYMRHNLMNRIVYDIESLGDNDYEIVLDEIEKRYGLAGGWDVNLGDPPHNHGMRVVFSREDDEE